MNILLAQISTMVGDVQGNQEKMIQILRQAEQQQADLVLFPELCLSAYPPEDLLLRSSFLASIETAIEQLKHASLGLHIALVFGAPRQHRGALYNSAFCFRNGELLAVYDKQALPNYGVFDERRYFREGQGTAHFDLAGQHCVLRICEDAWADDQPEDCDLVLHLNASPFHIDKQHERETLMRQRAQSWQATMVYVNTVGGQDELVFDGGSHVINAQGELLARAPLFQEHLLALDVQAKDSALVSPMGDATEQCYQALCCGLRDYVLHNACQQVVLGLSGGIDSALTAVIAVDALGADAVLGVLLPSRYSSEHSIRDAEALAANLGIQTQTLAIEQPVAAIESVLAKPFADWGYTGSDLTEENIQARIRGVLLMAISNKTGRMLLSTGNKSEMAVGYATLYGDMAGGFAVLKDVYKMDVFALSRWLNRDAERIPWNSIEKPPSAELRPDQKDSDSLPDYPVLDQILRAHIEDACSSEEIIRQMAGQGVSDEAILRVVSMVNRCEFKRRQSAPGTKLSVCAFGRERRYPMTQQFKAW